MKRIIAAVSFAVLAAPAFAVEIGAPYEQTQIDRQLPDVRTVAPASASSGASVVTTGSGLATGFSTIGRLMIADMMPNRMVPHQITL